MKTIFKIVAGIIGGAFFGIGYIFGLLLVPFIEGAETGIDHADELIDYLFDIEYEDDETTK